MTDLPSPSSPEGRLLLAFMHAIWDERHRAHDKHGATSMEQAPLLGHKRASVLTEEAVECARALNDHEHGEIVLRENLHEVGQRISGLPVRGIAQVGPIVDPLDKELIQTAAMAYTWWANRRGDQLAPPEQKPISGGHAPTLQVIFNGTPYTGVVDPATGTVHVHSVDRLVVEVQDPLIPPVPVRKSSDLSFHEVSFIRGPSDPSKGVYPILHVAQPGEVLVRALEVGTKGQSVRCVMVSGGGVYLTELPYDVVPGQTFTVKDPRPVSPPADDPDGGRRGD